MRPADPRKANLGDEEPQPGGIPPRVARAISLVVVLALILAASSVIIAATDGGIWIVLLIVAVAAGLVYRWGFRSGSDN